MNALLRGALRGAAAGAAGTTALNAVTYLDMTGRARPTSSTPDDTVEALTDLADVDVPGTAEQRDNRLAGLGALTGIVAGVGVGTLLGVARAAGWRPSSSMTVLAATLGALAAGNAPMMLLGVTDPRTWAPADWVADIVPHLAYGGVTALTLRAGDG